jgi:hypothetical protein
MTPRLQRALESHARAESDYLWAYDQFWRGLLPEACFWVYQTALVSAGAALNQAEREENYDNTEA